jgi:hypothetical protein
MYVCLGKMNDQKKINLITCRIIKVISFRAKQSLIIYRIQLSDVIVLPFVGFPSVRNILLFLEPGLQQHPTFERGYEQWHCMPAITVINVHVPHCSR